MVCDKVLIRRVPRFIEAFEKKDYTLNTLKGGWHDEQ